MRDSRCGGGAAGAVSSRDRVIEHAAADLAVQRDMTSGEEKILLFTAW